MENSGKRPLIVSHRGASAFAPENTFAAFSLAIEEGTDGVEFDVRLTRDGIPVVFHDAGLKRFTGNDIRISSLMSEDVAKVDAGSWFNLKYPDSADRRFAKEKIPTLEKTLEFFEGFTGTLYVELKSNGRNMVPLAKAAGGVLGKYSDKLQLVVKSFDNEMIPIVREHCPAVESAALFAPNIVRILRKESQLIAIAGELGANRLSLHFSLATRNLMKKARRAGLPVTIWTVDSPLWLRRSIDLGIDAIITNDPARMLAIRNCAAE